jgi:hypothetical protein
MPPNNAGSNMAMHMFLHQQSERVESSARSNAAMARSARTMEEAVRLACVSIPAEIRFMKNSMPGLRSLNHAIEDRLRELVQQRLKTIEDKPSAEEAKSARGRFMQECNVLRGDFAMIYRLADTESQLIVYLKTKAEKPAQEPDTPQAPVAS